jgi:hypothetical protein
MLCASTPALIAKKLLITSYALGNTAIKVENCNSSAAIISKIKKKKSDDEACISTLLYF